MNNLLDQQFNSISPSKETNPSSTLSIPPRLIKALKERRCILYVGVGVSTGLDGLPSQAEMIRRLAQYSGLCTCQYLGGSGECNGAKCCCRWSFQRLAEYFALNEDRDSLINFLLETIKSVHEPLPIHRTIARLHNRFAAIITTNYDELLERAFDEITGDKYGTVFEDGDLPYVKDKLMLFKLYGCVSRPKTILVTEKDHLISPFFKHKWIAHSLSGYLANGIALFVGFNLEDNLFQELYRDVRRYLAPHELESFAIESSISKSEIKFWAQQGIKILNCDLSAFFTQVESELSPKTGDLLSQLQEAVVIFRSNRTFKLEKRILENVQEQFGILQAREVLTSEIKYLLAFSAMHWYQEPGTWLALVPETEIRAMTKELLTSEYPIAQENAVLSTMDLKLEDALPELIQALDSPHPNVYKLVPQALVSIGTHSVAETLLNLSKDERKKRVALRTFSSLPTAVVLPVFTQYFSVLPLVEQKTILENFNEVHDNLRQSDEGPLETIVHCVNTVLWNANEELFNGALELLKVSRLDVAANYLATFALADTPRDRRGKVIRSLGRQRTKEVPQLLKKFLNEDEEWLRESAIEALSDLILSHTMLPPNEEAVRHLAVDILFETEDSSPKIRRLLRELVTDYDDEIQERIVRNLDRFFDKHEIPQIVRDILSSHRRSTPEDDQIRRIAAEIFVQTEDGSPATLELLIELTKDDDDLIRWQIVQNLKRFFDNDELLHISKEILKSREHFTSEDNEVRRWAEEILKTAQDGTLETIKLLQNLPGSEYERYSSAILAVIDDKNKPVGTSFLTFYKSNTFVVTCAHVIKSLIKTESQIVRLHHFSQEIGQLEAEVLWYRVPEGIDAIYWTAIQDVAILKPNSLLPSNLLPMILVEQAPEDYKNKVNCWCFGYNQSKALRGEWIHGISCQSIVSHNFIELAQSEATKIERGVSGAPLSDSRGNILGMIQSTFSDQAAYLIPSKCITDVLDDLLAEI